MEKELNSSKEFYILSCDIFKVMSVERRYRNVDGVIYLDTIHNRYCSLIEQSELLDEYHKKYRLSLEWMENIYKKDAKSPRFGLLKKSTSFIKPLPLNIPVEIEEKPPNERGGGRRDKTEIIKYSFLNISESKSEHSEDSLPHDTATVITSKTLTEEPTNKGLDSV